MAKLCVVKVQGSVGKRSDVLETLRMLGLTRVNHCVLIDDTPSNKGMLQKVKDTITWGEINREMLVALLKKRGRLIGNKKFTDEYIRANTRFSSIEEFAEAMLAGVDEKLPGLKKVFRLHPPRKGYKNTRRPFRDLGDLGYRGDKINELISRMI